ncbi:MAG: hypothetical protein ACHQ1D_11010 [Nitrososphaerales archaeon]|jgi:hypothetical protein
MDTKKIGIFAILSLSIVAVLTGTTGMSLLSPVFAGGDHHDHDGKKCKKNEDNNCNDTENNQKLTPKEDCDNETTIKDHSKKNDNGNVLVCSTDAVNLKDSVLLNSTIFGDTIEPIF